MTVGQSIKLVLGAIVVFVALYFVVGSATVIDQTERGVLTRFGEVQETLEPGLHFVNPFTSDVYKVDVTVQSLTIDELAYSQDSQIVAVKATVNYQIDPTKVAEVWQEVRGDVETPYLIPRSAEAIKNVVAKYSAQGIIEQREALAGAFREGLTPRLDNTGVILKDVAINNFDFDDKYEAAVQDKQVQEQLALAEANKTAQEKERKSQEILKAEALAEKTRLEVQALSTGGSEIIEKILAEAQLEAAKNWNGQGPSTLIMGSEDAANLPILPYMNVGR